MRVRGQLAGVSQAPGFESEDTEASVNDMARELPMIALRPREPVTIGADTQHGK